MSSPLSCARRASSFLPMLNRKKGNLFLLSSLSAFSLSLSPPLCVKIPVLFLIRENPGRHRIYAHIQGQKGVCVGVCRGRAPLCSLQRFSPAAQTVGPVSALLAFPEPSRLLGAELRGPGTPRGGCSPAEPPQSPGSPGGSSLHRYFQPCPGPVMLGGSPCWGTGLLLAIPCHHPCPRCCACLAAGTGLCSAPRLRPQLLPATWGSVPSAAAGS